MAGTQGVEQGRFAPGGKGCIGGSGDGGGYGGSGGEGGGGFKWPIFIDENVSTKTWA